MKNFYFYINASVLSFILNYYCFVECGGAGVGAGGARYPRGPSFRPGYGTSGSSIGAFSPFVPIGRPNVEYIAIPIVKKVTHHHIHHFIPKRAAPRGYARPLVGGYARPLVGGYAPALSGGGYAFGATAGAIPVAAPKYKPVVVGVITADKLCALTKGSAKIGGVSGGVSVGSDAYGSTGGQYSKRTGDIKNDEKKREYVPSAETVKLFKYLEKLGY